MEEAVLSFGTIRHLEDGICEVVVDDGVEMTRAMVDEYHDHLSSYYPHDFAILVNKKNDYTYDFEAQQHLATLPNIRAIAVLVYRRASEIATQALHNIKRDHQWNLRIFYDRDKALQWLESQLTITHSETA